MLLARLGAAPEAALAAELASETLAATTVRTYASHWNQFSGFCSRRGRSSLPATSETVALYLAHLCERGSIDPNNVQSHLSAINTVHKAVLLVPEGPARGPLIDAVRRGWRRRVFAVPRAKRDKNMPLPAFFWAV
jgi:hypothetical protein